MKMQPEFNNSSLSTRIPDAKVYLLFTFIFFALSTSAQDKRNDSRKLYEQGEAAHDAGNYELALDYFNRCLKESPGFADAYFTRGSTREALQDLEGANTDYNIYLELKPNQPEALLCRATVRYQLGLYQQAKEDFLKLLTLPTGETQTIFFDRSASATGKNQIITAQGSAIKPQIFNYLGLVETKLGNYKGAIIWLDSAISLQQKNADYFVNRGIAKEGLNDTTAMQDYTAAIRLRPDHAVALHNIAVLKRKQGGTTHEEDLEKAIESDSSMLYPYLERGYQRMEGGYYKGALEDYDRALQIQPKDPEIWLNRGHVKEKMNDLKGAYADYTRAIELDEKFEKAWLNRGNVLSKQGRNEEAVQDYSAALTFNPEYGNAYYNRAIAKQRLKQIAEACQDLEKAESLGISVAEKVKKEICK